MNVSVVAYPYGGKSLVLCSACGPVGVDDAPVLEAASAHSAEHAEVVA